MFFKLSQLSMRTSDARTRRKRPNPRVRRGRTRRYDTTRQKAVSDTPHSVSAFVDSLDTLTDTPEPMSTRHVRKKIKTTLILPHLFLFPPSSSLAPDLSRLTIPTEPLPSPPALLHSPPVSLPSPSASLPSPPASNLRFESIFYFS